MCVVCVFAGGGPDAAGSGLAIVLIGEYLLTSHVHCWMPAQSWAVAKR